MKSKEPSTSSSPSLASKATSRPSVVKNSNDFAPYERRVSGTISIDEDRKRMKRLKLSTLLAYFSLNRVYSLDIETYSLISEVSGQWSGLVLDPATDPEEDLCATVLSTYLVLMWRGVCGSSREDWRERSQVLSCINLLGLNNELYRSHLEMKRRLVEMIVQAVTTDLKQHDRLAASASFKATVHANCQHAIRWVYDLVVLDPHEDESKKISMKLLELTMAMLDALNVFREEDLGAQRSTEIYHIALGKIDDCPSAVSYESS